MKKMDVQSRLLSLLLVLALLWGFAAPASAAGAAHRDGVSFTQVDNSAVSASLLEQEADALWHVRWPDPHPGGGRPDFRRHPGANPPNRKQGHSQAAPSQPGQEDQGFLLLMVSPSGDGKLEQRLKILRTGKSANRKENGWPIYLPSVGAAS